MYDISHFLQICDALSSHPAWKSSMDADNVYMVAVTLAHLK
jgi:hypothetical protein